MRASGTDVILNLTAGMGGDFVPDAAEPWRGGPGTDMATVEDRLAHVVELRPEICTLDCGSMNYAATAYVSTPDMLRGMARTIRDAGVRPEIEVFELGHVWLAKQLIEEGLIETPALFQLCMGIPYGAEADPRALLAMRDLLPPGSRFAAFGIGRMQMPMVAQAVLAGRQRPRRARGQPLPRPRRAGDQRPARRARLRDRPPAGCPRPRPRRGPRGLGLEARR